MIHFLVSFSRGDLAEAHVSLAMPLTLGGRSNGLIQLGLRFILDRKDVVDPQVDDIPDV